MKKFLLLGTALCVASSVWAFSGIGIGSLQRHKSKSGVDAIGIHIDPTGKKANIDFSDGGEVPTKPTCASPLVLNETTNECECPSAQQCGETCCGEGNVCVDGTYCCFKDYEDNGGVTDSGMCCDATESRGYSTEDGGCCGAGSSPFITSSWDNGDGIETSCCSGSVIRTSDHASWYYQECCANGKTIEYSGVKACDPECSEEELPYISWYDSDDGSMETACCAGTPYQIYDDIGPYWKRFEAQCCDNEKIHTGVGYKGWNVCCDHDPQNYVGYRGTVFKVCWNDNTTCKTNKECQDAYGDGYYCNLVTDENPWSCNYPNQGDCEEIGDGTPETIAGLGNVLKSNNPMTWWAAENWCKAQGMRLASIEEIGCYEDGTTSLIQGDVGGGCCTKGESCLPDNDWLDDNNKGMYSTVLYNLEQAYGNGQILWTGSDYSNTTDSSCFAYVAYLQTGMVDMGNRNDGMHYALCVED